MLATREVPVAKSKKPNGPRKPGKARTHADRKGVYQPIQVFKDLARWLADISDHETRRLRDAGELGGQEFASVAKIVDPLLRDWAWQRLSRINNTKAGLPASHPIPPTPPPPGETVVLE